MVDRMRLAFGIVVFFGVLAGSAVAQEESSQETLAKFVGRDVNKMSAEEKQSFIERFRQATGDENALRKDDWEFVPQRLYEFAKPEGRFFVEVAPGFIRPGFCGLRIHQFDAAWKHVGTDEFSTGYRQEITEVTSVKSKVLGLDALVVKTKSAGPWELNRKGERVGTPLYSGKHQLQYYVLIDGRLMLVRREDETGRLVLNNYAGWSIPEIGRSYPKGTTEELLDILRAGSDPKRLALLAWISGRHLSSEKKRVKGVSQEPLESSKSHETLLNHPGLAKVIGDLGESDNQWLREYAESVSKHL